MAKRVQKRLQLKNMIILKFRNKYLCSVENEEELNQFIQDKMDDLFAEQVFDERDLIKVDKMILEKHQELSQRVKQPAIESQEQELKQP